MGADGGNPGSRPGGSSGAASGIRMCDSQEWFCGVSAYCNFLLWEHRLL